MYNIFICKTKTKFKFIAKSKFQTSYYYIFYKHDDYSKKKISQLKYRLKHNSILITSSASSNDRNTLHYAVPKSYIAIDHRESFSHIHTEIQ